MGYRPNAQMSQGLRESTLGIAYPLENVSDIDVTIGDLTTFLYLPAIDNAQGKQDDNEEGILISSSPHKARTQSF